MQYDNKLHTETIELDDMLRPAAADLVIGSDSTSSVGFPADDADFCRLLLAALTNMAVRSKRRQADLVAALRGAGLTAEPRRVRAALRLLQAQGAIDNLVPLSDGGLLLSVVNLANDQFGGLSQWLGNDEPELQAR